MFYSDAKLFIRSVGVIQYDAITSFLQSKFDRPEYAELFCTHFEHVSQ